MTNMRRIQLRIWWLTKAGHWARVGDTQKTLMCIRNANSIGLNLKRLDCADYPEETVNL